MTDTFSGCIRRRRVNYAKLELLLALSDLQGDETEPGEWELVTELLKDEKLKKIYKAKEN